MERDVRMKDGVRFDEKFVASELNAIAASLEGMEREAAFMKLYVNFVRDDIPSFSGEEGTKGYQIEKSFRTFRGLSKFLKDIRSKYNNPDITDIEIQKTGITRRFYEAVKDFLFGGFFLEKIFRTALGASLRIGFILKLHLNGTYKANKVDLHLEIRARDLPFSKVPELFKTLEKNLGFGRAYQVEVVHFLKEVFEEEIPDEKLEDSEILSLVFG